MKDRLIYLVFLGKIGVIDPGKLKFVANLGGPVEDVAYRNKVLDMFSVGFCIQLLQELVRAQPAPGSSSLRRIVLSPFKKF